MDINQLEIPTNLEFFDIMLSRKRKGTLKSTLCRGSIPHESILLVPLCTFTISIKGISFMKNLRICLALCKLFGRKMFVCCKRVLYDCQSKQ